MTTSCAGSAANAMSPGVQLTWNGVPGTGVIRPVDASMANTVMSPLRWFAAYRKPRRETARSFTTPSQRPLPVPPVGNGEPGTALSDPAEVIANAETVFGPFRLSFV